MTHKLATKILNYLILAIVLAVIAASVWPYGSVGLEARFFLHLASITAFVIWIVKKGLSRIYPQSRAGLNLPYSVDKSCYHPIYLPLGILLIISLVSILFSVYRYASILYFLNFLSYALLFFVVMEATRDRRNRDFLIFGIAVAGLFYSVYGILQYYGYLPSDYWTQEGSCSSRFVNSGSFGAFVNFNIFLSLGILSSRKTVLARIFWSMFPVIFIVSLILSRSRISWIVFLFMLILFCILFFNKLELVKKRRLILTALFSVMAISILFLFKSVIWGRLQVILPTRFQSLYQRIHIWIGAVKIILAHPLGAGIGTFQHVYPAYRIHSDRFVVLYAHSDFLQVAAELGIAGLMAFVWFVVRAFRQVSRVLPNLSHRAFFVTSGLLCACLSLLAQGILDFPLEIPANALLFFVGIALLLRYTGASNSEGGSRINEITNNQDTRYKQYSNSNIQSPNTTSA